MPTRGLVYETALIDERVEDVGQVVVGPKRYGRVHHVEVQVGAAAVARVSKPGDPLTAPDMVALLHLDAAVLQVGVEGVPPASDVSI